MRTTRDSTITPETITTIHPATVRVTVRARRSRAASGRTAAKDRYLAAFAHEIRQAVHASRSASALCRISSGGGRTRRACDVLDRQLERIGRLVDDVVDTARGALNKITIERARVCMSDVIETAVATARPRIDERQHC